MVKLAETVKERDLEPQFLAVLRGLLTRVPFLKLNSLLSDVPIHHPRAPVGRPDFIAKVQAGTHEWTLVAEAKKSGQPQLVRTSLLQLQRYLSLLPPDVPRYGIVLAPFISPESARLCTEAGMGYADLAGNCRLTFDNIYIETHGADNPFREKRALKSLFTPKAARILRVLLQGPLRPWKVKDLAADAGVSLGHVSDVRQQLIAQEWAVEDPAGLRVTRPSTILDAWAAADRWEDRTTVREYSLLLTDPADIAVRVDALLSSQHHAFTQWIAAAQRHPYTTPPVTTVYVTDFPDDTRLKDELLARRVDSGGRLRLVQPREAGVFNVLQIVNGLPLVSDVQIYLDLLRAGMRGDEAAAELRQWPDFAGGWPPA